MGTKCFNHSLKYLFDFFFFLPSDMLEISIETNSSLRIECRETKGT